MMFITVFAGVLDTRTGDIAFANAGHDHPYILRPGNPPRRVESIGGPPLCTVDDFPYPAENLTLAAGETLVLYTDGIPEAVNVAGEAYGFERLEAVLAGLPDDCSAAAATGAVMADVAGFTAGAEPSDDIAVLVLRYAGR
jgi:serine phosphatase RsbU (regulator of sigma subunit)